MSKQTVTAEVELDFADGKKTIEMEMKSSSEIEDCEIGKAVVLNLYNGETVTGIFKGFSSDYEILLGALSGKYMLGYKNSWVDTYFEEK